MEQALVQYFLQHAKVDVPGAGILKLTKQPALYRVTDRQFSPPQTTISFEPFADDEDYLADQQLTSYLARNAAITEEEVFEQLNEMAEANKTVLNAGRPIQFSWFGELTRQADGLRFEPATNVFNYPPIDAERVIRQHAVHSMKVGDTETDSRQMEEYYTREEERSDRWWIFPLVIAVIALLLLLLKLYS